MSAAAVAAFVAVGVWQTAVLSCRASFVCAETCATATAAQQQAKIAVRSFIQFLLFESLWKAPVCVGNREWGVGNLLTDSPLPTPHSPLAPGLFLLGRPVAGESAGRPFAAHLIARALAR